MSRRDANSTKVFVGSLPKDVTTDDLRELFTPYGKIVECDIANRCGFLHLEDKELALKSIEDLNNSTFKGGRISVEMGRVKPPRRKDGLGRGGKDRGGPYSRDNGYSRGPPRGYGSYGDRFGDYDLGLPPPPPLPQRGYEGGYEHFGERRLYEDRRGYMDDRRGYPPPPPLPSSYDRRYDEQAYYDDRRPPAAYDDRRSIRPLLDQASSGSDIYSRRSDALPKLGGYGDRDPYGSVYGGKSYENVRETRYADAYAVPSGYSNTDAAGYSASGYAGADVNSGSSYAGYSASGGYGDAYSSTRATGIYDTSYPLPPQRSFASNVSGGSGPRRDNPSGPGRRY